MAAVVDTAAIPPGGEGQIKVTLNTGNKTGELNKTIRVTTNDPRRRTSTIKVKATIELDFEFVAPSLYFSKFSVDETITKSAFLQVKDPAKTKILDVVSLTPAISARKVGYGTQGNKTHMFEIEVTIKPGMPIGQFLDTVIVHSNLIRKPTAILRITGTVSGAVEVNPPSLNFMVNSKETTGRNRTKYVYITNYQKKIPLEILDIIDQDDHLDFELEPTEEEGKFKLMVKLTEEDVPDGGNLSGTFKIITNNPDFKEFTIVYSAVWRI